MLRIGIDAWNLLGDRRGIGRYTRALIREWTTNFADQVELTLLVPESPAWWHAARYRYEAGGRKLRVRHRTAVHRARFDVLWFPWNGLSWSAPGPKVAVLHDASLFALPLPATERERELRPFRRAVSEGAHIITDSHYTRQELMKYLGLSSDSIDVVPLGVDLPPERTDPRIQPPPALDRPYLLFVGEFEARKGIDVLTDALALLPEKLRCETALVLAGETRGVQPAPVPAMKTSLLGHVDDEMLAELYRGAAAFVYPSRYEGFGLPVLEAMAHGVPVIASDATGIPEAGGDAARYFRSGEPVELAAAIRDVLTDGTLADRLRQRGKERAAAMSWANTARRTLEILRQASARMPP